MAYRIAKSLNTLRSNANDRWPDRKKASDGWIGDDNHKKKGFANSDHNPHIKDGATGIVTALDITHDPKSGCDAGDIAAVLIASRDPRIKYIIWNRKITSGDAGPSPWKARDYKGKNPHTMHVHISVKTAKSKYDDDADWAMPGAATPKKPSAPPPPVATKRPTLKKGDKGKDVRYLQKLLGVTIDGDFGDGTEKAVKKVQTANKLFADGIVGAYTWAALAK
jgi:hypothetical protein